MPVAGRRAARAFSGTRPSTGRSRRTPRRAGRAPARAARSPSRPPRARAARSGTRRAAARVRAEQDEAVPLVDDRAFPRALELEVLAEPAASPRSAAGAGGSRSQASCECECGRLAPAARPSLTPAKTYAARLARGRGPQPPGLGDELELRPRRARRSSGRARGAWTTTSCRSKAGYMFGTTRTDQPGVSGSRPSRAARASRAACGPRGPRRRGSARAPPASAARARPRRRPGRRDGPGAIATSRPESGSTRRSSLRSSVGLLEERLDQVDRRREDDRRRRASEPSSSSVCR